MNHELQSTQPEAPVEPKPTEWDSLSEAQSLPDASSNAGDQVQVIVGYNPNTGGSRYGLGNPIDNKASSVGGLDALRRRYGRPDQEQ